jgi:hypothetical protein
MCPYGFWAWSNRRHNLWSPKHRTKSIIQRWPINPPKCGHVQYLQTTLTIKHVAKCMHSVTVVARSLCYCPLHFQFVNVNFWCSVINSTKPDNFVQNTDKCEYFESILPLPYTPGTVSFLHVILTNKQSIRLSSAIARIRKKFTLC